METPRWRWRPRGKAQILANSSSDVGPCFAEYARRARDQESQNENVGIEIAELRIDIIADPFHDPEAKAADQNSHRIDEAADADDGKSLQDEENAHMSLHGCNRPGE